MGSLIKKHFRVIFIVAVLLVSAIGMMIWKQKLELSASYNETLEMQFFFFNIIFTLAMVYVVLSFLFNKWKEYRQLKNAHSKAQLELLKSKIDPHFFFNTLNNLYGLAMRKSEHTGPVILRLSEVMRYTIYKGEQEKVSLRDEIAYLKQYIEIHKIRYQKQVDISFEEELEENEFMIAPLLFINLVENAFKHGVEGLTDNAYLYMHMKAVGNTVDFMTENNFEPGKTKAGGLGIKNLKQRLALLYPQKHKLVIEEKEGVYKVKLNIVLS